MRFDLAGATLDRLDLLQVGSHQCQTFLQTDLILHQPVGENRQPFRIPKGKLSNVSDRIALLKLSQQFLKAAVPASMWEAPF